MMSKLQKETLDNVIKNMTYIEQLHILEKQMKEFSITCLADIKDRIEYTTREVETILTVAFEDEYGRFHKDN